MATAKKPAEKMTNCTFRIPVELLEAAQEMAQKRDESLSQFVRRALREYSAERNNRGTQL